MHDLFEGMLYGSGKIHDPKAMTGLQARELLENAMGYGSGFTYDELLERHEEACKIVQAEGIPQLIAQCRISNPALEKPNVMNGGVLPGGKAYMNSPAVMERAAARLAYIAERSGQVACNIVSSGGIRPLVLMLSVPVDLGDDDDEYSMQEVAVKALYALCVGDASNQRPVAEGGGIPPMLKMLGEADHPWSVRQAAAIALACLAKERTAGPAQEIITARGGVATFIAVHRDADCPGACKSAVEEALRMLLPYKPAKEEMSRCGVLRSDGGRGVELILE